MPALPEADSAALVLRLLLDDPSVDAGRIDWRVVGGMARRDRVPQRLAACLRRRGVRVPPRFADAVARDAVRRDQLLSLAARLGETCKRQGIPHVFLKLMQPYPDAGQDVDLLLADPSPAADHTVLDHLSVIRGRRRLHHRLAATTTYQVPACAAVLDLHHGRLGRLGEHARCADLVLRRRTLARIGSVTCFTPSLEDQLLLQAVAQSGGRRTLRLGDVYWTLATLRGGRVRWDALLPAAELTGLLPGLSCHLDYADQIHERLFGRSLLEAGIRGRLGRRAWGPVEFREGSYRFPVVRDTARLCLQQLRDRLAAGDWAPAARLCLFPMVAVGAGWRRPAAS